RRIGVTGAGQVVVGERSLHDALPIYDDRDGSRVRAVAGIVGDDGAELVAAVGETAQAAARQIAPGAAIEALLVDDGVDAVGVGGSGEHASEVESRDDRVCRGVADVGK